jgi:hypothetical protein
MYTHTGNFEVESVMDGVNTLTKRQSSEVTPVTTLCPVPTHMGPIYMTDEHICLLLQNAEGEATVNDILTSDAS